MAHLRCVRHSFRDLARRRTSRADHAGSVDRLPAGCDRRAGPDRRSVARRPPGRRRDRRVQAGGGSAEGRPGADRHRRTAIHRCGPRDDQGGLGTRVGGAAGRGERRAHRARRRAPGDVLPAHRGPPGGRRRRDGVRLRAERCPLHQVGPVPGAGGRRLDEGAGPLQGGAGLRGRPGARHLPPRLRPARRIEIGGAKLESFGKQLAWWSLPHTTVADRQRERDAAAAAKVATAAQAALPPDEGGDLPIDVRTGEVLRHISPYVYGINSQPAEGAGATVRRMGGNRQTAYNWELNASNAGSDYNHSSDGWACTVLGYHDCDVPGAQFLDFALANRQAGMETVATVPMVDYVTADKRGSVLEADKAPSKRWNRSVAQKPGPFATSPDLGDGVVYQDEFVNALVTRLGKAAGGGIRFYSLDNEPALWPGTHPRVHPDKTTYAEMVTRTEATATGLLKVDPSAFVLGAVAYGWSEFQTLQDAPDAKENNATYGTLSRLLPGRDEEAGSEAPPAAGPRARRPLVSRGARRQADHREGRQPQDRRGAPAGAAQPVGSELRREELDRRRPGRQADPPHPLAAGEDRRPLPRDQAGHDRVQLRRRRPHLGRPGAGRRAGRVRARRGLPGQLLGRQRRQQPPAELHQGGVPALPELRRPGGRVRRHRRRRRARQISPRRRSSPPAIRSTRGR